MNKNKISICDLKISDKGSLLCPDCGGIIPVKWSCGSFLKCMNYKKNGCEFTISRFDNLTEELKDIVKNNRIEDLQRYTKSGGMYAVDNEGNSLLMLSVIYQYEEMAKLLIDSGADVCHQNLEGDTALMLAVRDYPDFDYRILLKNGVDAVLMHNYKNHKTPLDIAIQENMKGVILNFVNAGVKINGSILRWAIRINYIDFIKMYFETTGINVNSYDASGNTFLIYAVLANAKDCVDFFLKKGALVYQRNKKDETALSIAKENNNQEIVKMLENRNLSDLSETKARLAKLGYTGPLDILHILREGT